LKLRAVDAFSDRKVWADFFTSEPDNLSAAQSKAADEIAASVQKAAAIETK
jgi:TolB-like protein